MYTYSSWLLTSAPSKYVTAFAEGVGNEGRAPIDVQESHLIRRVMEHDDQQDSVWDASRTHGGWVIGVADLDVRENRDGLGPRLVGVITPSASLTEHLANALADFLQSEAAEHERVIFSLRALLQLSGDQDDAHLFSVRLLEDLTRILVQSNDESALRETLAGLPGDPIGLTMRTDEGQVTVTAQGPVIFTDSTSPAGVLGSMRRIAHAVSANLPARA